MGKYSRVISYTEGVRWVLEGSYTISHFNIIIGFYYIYQLYMILTWYVYLHSICYGLESFIDAVSKCKGYYKFHYSLYPCASLLCIWLFKYCNLQHSVKLMCIYFG